MSKWDVRGSTLYVHVIMMPFCWYLSIILPFTPHGHELLARDVHNVVKMSRVVRKPAFCICENKGADQLRGNREADQRLCFRFTDSTIPLLPIYEISSI